MSTILAKIKDEFVQKFISAVDTDKFYVFASRVTPFDDENTPDEVTQDDDSSFYDVQREMLFGVRVTNTDIVAMTTKNTWESNTVYDEYDDKDTELDSKEFFIITSARHVFKCIFNNNDSVSTVEPSNTTVTGLPPTESDGYRWQYMYTISEAQMNQFGTTNYIPVYTNANVVSNAIDGGILNIKVLTAGSDYPNNTGTMKLLMNGPSSTANLSTIQIANAASESNGYYNNCAISVINGSNEVNVREILTHFSNSTGRFVTVKVPFANTDIANNFNYTIAPHVLVESYGNPSDIIARAIMNANTGGIEYIDIIDAGEGYVWADASVQTSPGFGSGGTLRAVISPPGGHGFDVKNELYCHSIGIGVEFSNTVSFGHPSEVTYRTVGVIKNPLDAANSSNIFANTHFNQVSRLSVANNSATSFDAGETIEANSSRKRVTVAFANSSVVITTGDDGSYLSSDTLLNSIDSGTQYALNSVTETPDLVGYSGEILHIQNIQPISRSETSSENIKLIITL